MNHYCTYFDRNFLIQGLALATSLREHDPESVLWVLCLDDFTESYLEKLADDRIRTVSLAELEAWDRELVAVKGTRRLVEYYFTLSPCWPRYLLHTQPGIACITYVDADMFFFASPQPIFAEMGEASIVITEHRYPAHLTHHLRCGRFNVGLLCFRNDETGRDCLDWWRDRCIEWCHDRVEDGKYADQRYLDEWPARYGNALCVLSQASVNLAPWNWVGHRYGVAGGRVTVDGEPLLLFHFARFRPSLGLCCFQSGQLEYGVMSWGLRQRIYGRYWQALHAARRQIRAQHGDFDFARRRQRGWHKFWRALAPRLLFGSDWIRVGPFFVSGRFGLGRFSGHVLAGLRQIAVRLRPPPEPTPSISRAPAFAAPPQQRE